MTTASAKFPGDLSDQYHKDVLLRFLVYTMEPPVRKRLMEHHPLSYNRIVKERRY